MNLRHKSRARRWWGVGVVLAVVALFGAFADRLYVALPQGIRHYESKIGQRLIRHGVIAYWSFDAPRITEAVALGTNITDGTRLEAGRFGLARHFVAGGQSFVQTSVPLGSLGDRFSISCWLMVPPSPSDQSILHYVGIHDGKLTVTLPRQNTFTCAIPVTNTFFHFALTVDGPQSRARLYVNGKPQGDYGINPVAHRPETECFGESRWRPPCSFTLDEVSFWNRPLAEDEVQRLSSAWLPVAFRFATGSVVKFHVLTALQTSFRSLLLTMDLFNPFLCSSRVHSTGLPDVTFLLSAGDVRAFNKYHNFRSREGLNDSHASSKKRRIGFVDPAGECAAMAELVDDPGRAYAPYQRKTFRVVTDPDSPGARRELLYRPMENTPFMLELTAAELARQYGYPYASPQLCVLHANNTFEGIYLSRELTTPQGLTWSGVGDPWRACLARLPVSRREATTVFDAILARHRGALMSDRKCPLSTRELLRGIALQRKTLLDALAGKPAEPGPGAASRIAEYLGADLCLGGNAAATLVVKDLDFALRAVPGGVALSYRSLTPNLVSDDGRIRAPGDAAATATVDVTISTTNAELHKPLIFQILPSNRKLPVLRVDALGAIDGSSDTPCVLEYTGPGTDAGVSMHGRIRYRGNTALVKATKHFYLIKTDEPVSLGCVPPTSRLLLTSCYRDPTFMRDKLSYDLFRSFSEPGKPRYVPHIQFVELVVCNDYAGIYGMMERIDADSLRLAASRPGDSERPVIYKSIGGGASFREIARSNYIQKEPDWESTLCWGPYESLIKFIGETAPDVFRARVEQTIDVDNIMDFEILLLLTNNMEGRNANLYIVRDKGPGARFFLVPWDYDMTFRKNDIPSNALIERLHHDLPGYTRRMQLRWRQLRQGRLSEAEIMARLDEMDAVLAEGMERNFTRWPLFAGRTHGAHVEDLREWIRRRLVMLDQHVAAMGGPAD